VLIIQDKGKVITEIKSTGILEYLEKYISDKSCRVLSNVE